MNVLRCVVCGDASKTQYYARVDSSSNLALRSENVRPIRSREYTCAIPGKLCSIMDDEVFVEAVRGFRSLWQPSSKSYKNVIAKENAWKLVATQVPYILE